MKILRLQYISLVSNKMGYQEEIMYAFHIIMVVMVVQYRVVNDH